MIIKFNSTTILEDKVIYSINGLHGLNELTVKCNGFEKHFYRDESDYSITIEIPKENHKGKIEFSYYDEILINLYVQDSVKYLNNLNINNINIIRNENNIKSINISKVNINIYKKTINESSFEIPKINIIKFSTISNPIKVTSDYQTGFNNGLVIGQLL